MDVEAIQNIRIEIISGLRTQYFIVVAEMEVTLRTQAKRKILMHMTDGRES